MSCGLKSRCNFVKKTWFLVYLRLTVSYFSNLKANEETCFSYSKSWRSVKER